MIRDPTKAKPDFIIFKKDPAPSAATPCGIYFVMIRFFWSITTCCWALRATEPKKKKKKSKTPLKFHAKTNVPTLSLPWHQSLAGSSPFPFLIPVDRSVSAWFRGTLGLVTENTGKPFLPGLWWHILARWNLRLFLLPESFLSSHGLL